MWPVSCRFYIEEVLVRKGRQDLLKALGVAHFPDLIADSAEYEFLLQRLAFKRGVLVEELLVAVGVCWHDPINNEISPTGRH